MKPLVVLDAGLDGRWLGSSVRARNERVAHRGDARLVSLPDLAGLGDRRAFLVPSGTAINPSLFASRAHHEVAALESTPGAGRVLSGPAAALARTIASRTDTSSLPTIRVAHDAVLDVSTRAARARATRIVLHGTVKATDGWVSRRCNRPISRAISRGLLALGASAWQASGLTLLVGLAAAFFAAQPGPLGFALAGVLFHLASVVDGVDGEIARATLTESKAGARLDTIIDYSISIACLAGVAIGWVREGGGPQVFWWSVAIAVLIAMGVLRSGLFVSRYAPNASFVFVDSAIRRAARMSSSLLLRGAAKAFTVFRRDVFALMFMIIGLSGRRVWVPIIVFLGGIIANVTFAVFSRELASAGEAEAAAAASTAREPAASVS